MTFNEFVYSRPDLDALLENLQALQKQAAEAKSFEEFLEAFKQTDRLNRTYASMETIASIRHTIDTSDPFYEAEDEFFQQSDPYLQNESVRFYEIVRTSPWLEQLKETVPSVWFETMEHAREVFSEEIIEDLQKEAKLASAYQKLIASAQVDLDGKTWNLSSLNELMCDSNPAVRKKAHLAYWSWFADHEEKINDIYDQMVHLRDGMAKKLGFENYVKMGYKRMNRIGYGPEDIAKLRTNVLKDAVKAANVIYGDQKKRRHLESLPVWEEKELFDQGNPKPIGTEPELVEQAERMYRDLDEEAGTFFERMVLDQLMDLASRDHKAAGGYCTFIPDENAPFIFANFSGTRGDVEVLTHEAGHAFQSWSARDAFPSDLIWPTMEAAEIASMSMEFLTWPWMENFFQERADDFKMVHLADAIKFIPYGTLIDHFQEEVYRHPDWTPQERMAAFARLEKEYLPHKDYSGIPFLEKGGWWHRQLHVFMDPFYYIDYVLAQSVALQFWKRMIEDDPNRMKDYKALCKAGGTLPFLDLVRLAGCVSPFEEGALKASMDSALAWMDREEMKGKDE